jgi:hypothetical protein
MPSDLTSELQRIRDNQLTGIVFIASGDNRSAQISFLDGVMVFAQCQGQKGRKAIELIAQMAQVRFRFQKGPIPASRVEMPSADEVIACMHKVKKTDAPHAFDIEKYGFKQTIKQTSDGGGISLQERSVIQEVLVECIGPMAMILCEDFLEKTKTVEEAIEAIANEIPAQQAVRFREGVLRRL